MDDLVCKVRAPNFESIGVKLQVNLTLSNGVEKVGEVVLPENIMQASPAQLREMGESSSSLNEYEAS